MTTALCAEMKKNYQSVNKEEIQNLFASCHPSFLYRYRCSCISWSTYKEKVFWQNIIENKIFCQFRKFLQNVEKENSLLLSKHYQNVMCITGSLLRGLGFQDRKKSQPFYNQADTTHCIYILKINNN